MSDLRTLLDRHCDDGSTITPVPGLTLHRAPKPSGPHHGVSYPLFCVIAEGRKRVLLGNEEFAYDPGSYLVSSIDLPISGKVVEAPFLGLSMEIDPKVLASLVLEMPPPRPLPDGAKGMAVHPLDDDLRDPLLRLLRLLDRPGDIAVMAPLIQKEILYRLLLGPRGEMLRQRAVPSSSLSQIGRVIERIRNHFNMALSVEELSREAGMSPASFHRHFKAVTAMSPLQFQKQIRLQEARRRLMSEASNASSVAFDVGYESPSQFSREYRRLFGTPPARDKAELIRSLEGSQAV